MKDINKIENHMLSGGGPYDKNCRCLNATEIEDWCEQFDTECQNKNCLLEATSNCVHLITIKKCVKCGEII